MIEEDIKKSLNQFSNLLKEGTRYIANAAEEDLKHKTSANSWSKQEILGHLIDSGTHNLQRFLEIQFASKPYQIRKYNQDELVKHNAYNEADPMELLSFWLSINERIIQVISKQEKEVYDYQIQLVGGEFSDFRFLFTDYVIHLEHHVRQILA